MKTISLLTCLTVLLSLKFPVAVTFTPSPPVPESCKMSNGQNRLYPCEFKLQTMFILGKNNQVVGTMTPAATSVKLPKSKAVKVIHSNSGDAYFYNVSLDIKRINTPSFLPKPFPVEEPKVGFYEVGTSTVTSPISPGEVTVVKRVDIGPDLPKPDVRPTRVGFTLQLNYTTGTEATIVAPVQYVQIRNPITFTKFPLSVNQYRDRAEAWMAFSARVDMTQ